MFAWFKALSMGRRVIAVLGTVLFLIAIVGAGYYFGRQDGTNISKVQISNYQKDVAKLETELANSQVKIVTEVVTKYRDRVQTVEVERVKLQETIKEVPVQYPLSNGWVLVHNGIVTGMMPTDEQASDKSPSGVFDAEALKVIGENYQTCKLDRARFNALIDWVDLTIKSSKEANEKLNK